MGYWDWDYEYKPRRKAANGIKAKSQRGQIGQTWWSGKFIRILESFNIGARLTRGRSYARSGQVMNLVISTGSVTAKVQGSSSRPYKVSIKVNPLTEEEWSRVEKAMAAQALFMAKLLAGEMPPEIEDAFTASQLKLFPARHSDIESDCSCPDWSNPCKHIAAVYYILAEAFDDDPFLIFTWRGRTKEELIENLRKLRGAEAESADQSSAESALRLPTIDAPPLSDCLNDFWKASQEFSKLTIQPTKAEIPDALLRQLGPAPVQIKGKNLTDILTPAYQSIVTEATRKAYRTVISDELVGKW